MDENTKSLVAGLLTVAFYANQAPIESRIKANNVPPEAPKGALEEMQTRELSQKVLQTFEGFLRTLSAKA